MQVRVYTFALPTVAIMDLISDAVDFPWWAYIFLFLGLLVRIVYTSH